MKLALSVKYTVDISQTKHDAGLKILVFRSFELWSRGRTSDASGLQVHTLSGSWPIAYRTRTHKPDGLSPGISGSTCWCAGGTYCLNWTAALRLILALFFPRSDERVSNVRSLFLGRGAHAACQREEVVFLTFQYLLYY